MGRVEERAPALRASGGATIEAGTGTPASIPAERPRFWAGLRDSRLRVDPRALPPAGGREVYAPATADVVAAVRADSIRAARAAREYLSRRQVTVFGRRVTVGGDSAAAGFRNQSIENRRGVHTMWVDGRIWERLQMSNQNDRTARDSAFQERARATRERNQARRDGSPKRRLGECSFPNNPVILREPLRRLLRASTLCAATEESPLGWLGGRVLPGSLGAESRSFGYAPGARSRRQIGAALRSG